MVHAIAPAEAASSMHKRPRAAAEAARSRALRMVVAASSAVAGYCVLCIHMRKCWACRVPAVALACNHLLVSYREPGPILFPALPF